METKDIIRSLRKKRDYSAQQVADGCEMSLGVYKKYESGERGVGVPALSKLADFYNVSVDYLLGRKTSEQTALDELAGEFNMTLLEKKIVELNTSIKTDVATKEELKKKLLEKKKKIYEMREILIENGLLVGGDDSE